MKPSLEKRIFSSAHTWVVQVKNAAASSTVWQWPLFFVSLPFLYPHLWGKLPPEFETRTISQELTWLGTVTFLYMVPFTPKRSPHQCCWISGIRRTKQPPAAAALSGLISLPVLIWEPSLSLWFQPGPSSERLPVNISCWVFSVPTATPLGSLPCAWTPSGIVTQTHTYPWVSWSHSFPLSNYHSIMRSIEVSKFVGHA